MFNYQKIACTCISAYTDRKLTDPNCCACSCDYNDVVDELNNLREENAALQAKINDLMSNECLKMSTDSGLDIRKIKADAIRDAMKDCEYRVTGVGHVISHVELSKYADKIERGEE